jgi:ELWxxDGT repeat protein
MSQRQRRAKMSRRSWHARATRNMSAAAVATTAALAVGGLEAGASESATPGATQVTSVATLSGTSPTISAPIAIRGTLFYGTAAAGGGKLWESDGTSAGTKLLKTIKGKSDAAPTELTNVAGHLYFEADGELWKSNGTPAGTVAVDTHVDPTVLANADGTVFFETTRGLWKTHGTKAKTTEVKALKLGTQPELVAVKGSVFFSGPKSGPYGTTLSLWTSNGSSAGTKAVKFPRAETQYPNYLELYDPTDLTTVGGHLFFEANSGGSEASYTDLWEASGPTATQVEPYGSDLTNVNGSLYFFDFQQPENCNAQAAAEGDYCKPATGYSLWQGNSPLFDFAPSVNAGSNYDSPSGDTPYVGGLTAVGSTLFFATNLGGPTQLWDTDGTLAGLHDVGPVPPHELINVDGTLFFTANDGTNGTQVWTSNGAAPASDGTDAGTVELTNFPASTNAPTDLTNLGGSLYFTGNDGSAGGYGLWKLTP